MFKFNKDYKARDTIVFGDEECSAAYGGIKHFDSLSAGQLKELIEEKFANPEECQNNSPSIAEFLEFMERNPEFRAIGYVVDPKRDDYRVSVEGVLCDVVVPKDVVFDFIHFSRGADELTAEETSLRAWWD